MWPETRPTAHGAKHAALRYFYICEIIKIRKEAKRMEGFEKVGDGLAHVLLIVSFGR